MATTTNDKDPRGTKCPVCGFMWPTHYVGCPNFRMPQPGDFRLACGMCGGAGTIPDAGSRRPCWHCAPEAVARRAERQERLDAEATAAKMIRLASGKPLELFPLPPTSLPAGEIGGPAKNACCDQAFDRACVCMRSYHCPVHGTTCIGTHD